MSDSQVNNRKSKALRNGKLIDEKWSGVQVSSNSNKAEYQKNIFEKFFVPFTIQNVSYTSTL